MLKKLSTKCKLLQRSLMSTADLQQGRKLFILDSCFSNPDLTWPALFHARGAIRVKTYQDIMDNL